jgi:glycosyltransferase involved in cell wall biosynthesis
MHFNNKDILILGHAKFDSPFESTGYTIARYLAKTNRVFYVEHPFTWKDFFRFYGKKEMAIRLRFFRPWSDGILETDIPGLKVVIVPPVFSINFLPEGLLYRALLRLKEGIVTRRLKRVIRKYALKDIIYINIFNFHFPNISRAVKPALNVYYCVDPMIVPYDMKHGITSENQLVKNSDLVICSSRQLYEEKKLQNPDTFFIPNAADLSHSSKALNGDLPLHPLLNGLPRPVIGYFGNIERRMDFDLIHEIVSRNPQFSFVLAGPVSREFLPGWVSDFSNLHLPGRIPFEEMPMMLKGFDVAIIPFKKDAVSQTIFPLKLFEYLGAGKPVVCTDFNPDLAEFTGDTVAYCADAASFSDALKAALAADKHLVGKSVEIAAKNTWDARILELGNLLAGFSEKTT